MDNTLHLITADQVLQALEGEEESLVELVRETYLLHRAGDTSLPHSTFVRFPGNSTDRIIALPAYLGGTRPVAGMKWIASFPANVQRGLDRAQAVVIINSLETGRPVAVLEGSTISAKRTAASAALAAQVLHSEGAATSTVGLVGTGRINFEILRFLRVVFPGIKHIACYDHNRDRALAFVERAKQLVPDGRFRIVPSCADVIRDTPLMSFATTAGQPYLDDLDGIGGDSTILNISLRDFGVQAVLGCDNIADDTDHVCRASTSLHLAEQAQGNRTFIRAALADVLCGEAPPRSEGKPSLFSPFGLGILDLALAGRILDRAQGKGTHAVTGFFSGQW